MKPAPRLLSAASAIALSLTPAVGGGIALSLATTTAADAAVVRSISVTGNKRIPKATIADIVNYSAGKNYSAVEIDEAVKRLFATGLFSDVNVTTSGSTLVVRVNELAVVNQVIFRGNRKQKDDRLRAVVQLKPRSGFDQATLDSDVQAIVDSYSRIGRNDVTVDAQVVDLGQNRVNVVYQVQEGDRTKISRINFIGNNAFSDRRLQGIISTKETNPLSWLFRNDVYDEQRLSADEEQLRRFYFDHGYADFRVLSSSADVDPASGNIVINIEVDEGERYAFGNVGVDSTVDGVDTGSLQGTIATRQGKTYSASDVEDTLISMSEKLAAEGFPFAEVTPVGNRNFENRTIDVSYVVDQGQRAFIERIEIVGNDRTRDYVIRREFDLAEGDAFNQIMLRRAKKRLEALDFFQTVEISTRAGSAPDRVIVVVNAVDKPTGEFGVGAGYTTGSGTGSGPQIEASISERNFLGRGQAIRISAGGGRNNRTYNLSFTEPYFLGYRLPATFRLFKERQEYTGYDVTTQGGSVNFGLPITEDLQASVGYQFKATDINDPDGSAFSGAPLAIKTEADKAPNWTSSALTYGLTYNTIDDRQDPHEGVYLNFNQEVAGLGGDARYISSTVKGRYYKTLADDADVVASLQFGAGNITGIGQNVRTVDHFRLGPQQIRGFAYNGIGPTEMVGTTGEGEHLGGKNYMNVTAEAQFPMPAIPRDIGLKGAVFADAATLFGHDSAYAANTSMEWRASAGVSLIWQSPFAPLRFDYAIPIKKEPTDDVQRFNFSVSTAF